MSVNDLAQYIPHALGTAAVAVATLGSYIFKDHADRDDARFAKTFELLQSTNTKLDSALAKQAENHTDVLKILLEQKSK